MEDVQVVQKTPHLYTDTPHHLLAPLGIEEHVKFPKRANLVGTMVMLVLFSMGFICVLLLKSMSGADKQELAGANQRLFMKTISISGLDETLQEYTKKNRLASTVEDLEFVEYLKNKAVEFGIPSRMMRMENESVALNQPRSMKLKLKLNGEEDIVLDVKDQDSLPFHRFSMDGQVEAFFVYANFGRYADFQHLAEMNISVNNTIVLVRYGKIPLGGKISNAKEFGAKAVLSYNDPTTHSTIPQNSVSDDTTHVCGMAVPESSMLPSMPISGVTASQLLNNMGNSPVVNATWSGGFGLTYHYASANATLMLEIENEIKDRTIWNLIVTIDASKKSDHSIVIGNQRDSAYGGAINPGSGIAIFVELLRGIGELLRTGWMPKRQIILASFDAEEYGLVGSTTWMNKNEFALKHHALAYLYIGASVLGKSPKLTISTSDALSALLVVATKFVEHPVIADVENDTAHVVPTLDDIISPNKKMVSLYDTWKSSSTIDGEFHPETLLPGEQQTFCSPFTGQLGIPSATMQFRNEFQVVQQSSSDTYDAVRSTYDPSLKYHLALAQVWSNVLLSLSDSPLVPFSYLHFSSRINSSVQNFAQSLKPDTALHTDDLIAASTEFNIAAENLDKSMASISFRLNHIIDDDLQESTQVEIDRINARMRVVEQAFISKNQLVLNWYNLAYLMDENDFDIHSTIVPLKNESEMQSRVNSIALSVQQVSRVISVDQSGI